MGLWPDEKNHSVSSFKQLRAPLVILLIFMWYCLPVNLALVQVIGDLSLVVDNMINNTASFSAMFKIYFLWRSKKSKDRLTLLIKKLILMCYVDLFYAYVCVSTQIGFFMNLDGANLQ